MKPSSISGLVVLLMSLPAPDVAPGQAGGAAPRVVPGGSIRASVSLTVGGRTSPAQDAVVWIPGSKAAPQPAQAVPEIASFDKRFRPRVLAVPVGSVVAFPNLDPIFHNVFSLSETRRFDLGLYRKGDARKTRFDKPGLVRIYCNIHPQMAAFILVVDGEILGQTGPDGAADLEGVAPGLHTVRVWQERGGSWSGTAEVRTGQTSSLTVVLDGSSWHDAPHKNKYGKDYPPPDDDENRY